MKLPFIIPVLVVFATGGGIYTYYVVTEIPGYVVVLLNSLSLHNTPSDEKQATSIEGFNIVTLSWWKSVLELMRMFHYSNTPLLLTYSFKPPQLSPRLY